MIDASLSFHPLSFVLEEDNVTVGRTDVSSYAVFPVEGAELLKQMQKGLSPTQAAEWYMQQYHESIDIEDFLATLQDLQFISEEGAVAPVTNHSSQLWQRLGNAAFSPVAYVIYLAIFITCFCQMIADHRLIPSANSIFFSPSLSLVEIGLFVGQMLAVFFHELFHTLAASRLRVPARLSVSHRWYYLVFETDLTGLWGVPRRARYLPFLAGMLADALWFSILTIVASITLSGNVPFLSSLCLAFAFATVMRLQWQFYFYMQTDLYYVMITFLKCTDLQQVTKRYLRNRICRFFRQFDKVEDESLWSPQDLRVARWYALFYGAGVLISVLAIFTIILPIMMHLVYQVVMSLTHGLFTASFWDSTLFLLFNCAQFVLIGVLFFQKRRAANARTRHS